MLYGSDCIELNKSMLNSLENSYSQLYSKLFHTFNKNIIKQCQFYSGQMPIELKIASRRLNFLQKVNNSTYCRYFDLKSNELVALVNKYCCASDGHNLSIVSDSLSLQNINWNSLLRNYVERSLEELD